LLCRQRKEDDFCDVLIEVEGEKFQAHRNVLSACSEYFYKMFTTNVCALVLCKLLKSG